MAKCCIEDEVFSELMDGYIAIKVLHVLSASILFGTGLGIAFFMFVGMRSRILAQRLFAARATVIADFCFTLPAVVLQPLTGIFLIYHSGINWNSTWLLWTYGLYVFAGLCWVPVVFIQLRLHSILKSRDFALNEIDQSFDKLFRLWIGLGFPAFFSVIAIYWLMIAKPL